MVAPRGVWVCALLSLGLYDGRVLGAIVKREQRVREKAGAVAGGLSDGTNANAVCFYPLTPNPKRKKVITRNEQL